MANTYYQVAYRTGGTQRCEWRLCLPVATKAEAEQQARNCARAGYKALVAKASEWETIGLPQGWNYEAGQIQTP